MGNTQSNGDPKRSTKRKKRRTSVLLQHLSDPEFRRGQLLLKEHAYLWKEVIYLEQYISNLDEEIEEIDTTLDDATRENMVSGIEMNRKELEDRLNLSRERLKEVVKDVKDIKLSATKELSKSNMGEKLESKEDVALLKHVDAIINSSKDFFEPVSDGMKYIDDSLTTVKNNTGVVGELVIGSGQLGAYVVGEAVSATGRGMRSAIRAGDNLINGKTTGDGDSNNA